MSDKVWGLTPRWDGTQGLMQWAQIIGGWILGFLVLGACGVSAYTAIKTPPVNQWPCSAFQDYRVENIPARCLSYFKEQP